MAFTEDLTMFFDTGDFAVAMTHDASTYNVIFDAEYSGDDMMAGSLPMAMLSASDAANVPVLDTVTISAVNYTVREKNQDGTGVVNLILEEQ